MQGELSAIGDIMTGTIGARALEPRTGDTGHGHGDGLCLNCGTRLTGAYCHACGQSAEVHRSVGAIGHEIAHGVFHFEGKVWRTLPLLVLHPGTLTRRYVMGERARFVSPLALFLFTVFLLFATISWVGWDVGGATTDAAPAAHQIANARAMDKADTALAKEQRRRQELIAAGQADPGCRRIDRRLADDDRRYRPVAEPGQRRRAAADREQVPHRLGPAGRRPWTGGGEPGARDLQAAVQRL